MCESLIKRVAKDVGSWLGSLISKIQSQGSYLPCLGFIKPWAVSPGLRPPTLEHQEYKQREYRQKCVSRYGDKC